MSLHFFFVGGGGDFSLWVFGKKVILVTYASEGHAPVLSAAREHRQQGFSRGRFCSGCAGEGSLGWESAKNPDLEGGRPPDPDLEGTVLSGLCAAPSVPKPSLEPLSGPLAHPVTTCVSSARRSLVMAAVEQPVPVLSIVDPTAGCMRSHGASSTCGARKWASLEPII